MINYTVNKIFTVIQKVMKITFLKIINSLLIFVPLQLRQKGELYV